MERGAHRLPLVGRELGAVAADATIDQAGHAVGAVEAAPVHQAGAAAAGNLLDLGDGVARAVEPDGLIPGAGRPVLGALVRLAQLGGLGLG